MIDILALLAMVMSMTSAIKPIALNSSAVVIIPSVIVLQRRSASLNPENCALRGPSVARRDDYTYTPEIGGHKLHSETVIWNEARLACEKEGGHLAIINSVEESKAIAKLFEKSPTPPGTSEPNCAHIGFHDLYVEGQFVTIHGQSLAKTGFAEWASGEPNNCNGPENCGTVHRSGRLNDLGCHIKARFICEIPLPSP